MEIHTVRYASTMNGDENETANGDLEATLPDGLMT